MAWSTVVNRVHRGNPKPAPLTWDAEVMGGAHVLEHWKGQGLRENHSPLAPPTWDDEEVMGKWKGQGQN